MVDIKNIKKTNERCVQLKNALLSTLNTDIFKNLIQFKEKQMRLTSSKCVAVSYKKREPERKLSFWRRTEIIQTKEGNTISFLKNHQEK